MTEPSVRTRLARLAREVDLDRAALAALLSDARDAGVARARAIAQEHGPAHGWPTALAERYLTRCLCFTLDARLRAGAERFAELARAAGLVREPTAAATNADPVGGAAAAGQPARGALVQPDPDAERRTPVSGAGQLLRTDPSDLQSTAISGCLRLHRG